MDHDRMMQIIHDVFDPTLPRLAPGDDQSTRRALEMLYGAEFTAGTHTFEPLEFLARLLAHVPRKNEIYVRYYGAYSVRRRAAWRARGIRPGPRLPDEPIEPVHEAVRARRRRWAELLRRVWDVDVSLCPTCGGPMTILTFTLDPAVIDATLRRIREAGHDPRAGPWAGRDPPVSTPA